MYQPEHEKLEVYARVVAVARELEDVARSIPDYRSDLQLQLRRASTSIVFNLAEGANEYRAAEKERFYRMSRRSAGECLSILDVIGSIVTKPVAPGLRDRIVAVMETLTKLGFGLRRRAP